MTLPQMSQDDLAQRHAPERPLHPRPQLTRAGWLDLSGRWGFAYDDAGRGLVEGWQTRPEVFSRVIEFPYPPESPASGIGETGFHPIVWYRTTFQAPQSLGDDRVLLHCGAVDYGAQVWVNGQLVASHEGGHTPFSADITEALAPDTRDQALVIRAEDQPHDLTQPRGKQDWRAQPHAIWYHRTTGVWQPVWLEQVPATHIVGIRWTPDVEASALGMQVDVRCAGGAGDAPAAPLRLRAQISLRGAPLLDDTYTLQSDTLRRTLALDLTGDLVGAGQRDLLGSDGLLWSPEHPNLLDVTLTLLRGDVVVDTVESYVGMRCVGCANGRFLLNGRPYYLRMALEQGYWPDTHLAAPGDEALRREVELAKALGFNGLRLHQKVEDPRFLYWCDRLGLVVWGEMANSFEFSPRAVERLTREWLEAVARDYSHPCVAAWVPFNESWGVPQLERDPTQRHYVQALYHLTKALDPTRPVLGNDGWEHVVGDIIGIHDYAAEGETLRSRYGTPEAIAQTLRVGQPSYHALSAPGFTPSGQPVMLTEFGGLSFRPDGGPAWFGYGVVADEERLLAAYRDLVSATLACPGVAGFCYTQLTDTRQETNGLLTAERIPKVAPEAIRAINQQVAAAIPADAVGQTVERVRQEQTRHA